MALRYPTQPLKVAASTPTLSLLHFVSTDNSQRPPTYQALVRKFANLQTSMTYTVIKDEKQIEHNYSTLIEARARCALPMSLDFYPVVWLHIPLCPETGAVDNFLEWYEAAILRILSVAVQRLVRKTHDEAPSALHYPYVCDLSRMYCVRAEPCVNTATILRKTTSCWKKQELVDQAIH